MGDSKGAEIEKQLSELKEWVARTPNVGKNMGDKMLRKFLHSCYYDLERTKKTMIAFTSIRASSPEIFTDRDPRSARVKNGLQIMKVAQLQTSGNKNLWILQLNDPGLSKFDHVEFVRGFSLATDARFLEEDNLQEEDIFIMDAKDMGLKIFWKIKMSLVKKLSRYQEEAIPIRLKQMHMVNAPYFIDKLFAITKQFMSKETIELVHFHAPNSDTLFEFISKDELPSDLGGNLDSLDVYNQKMINLLHKHRESLMKDDLWIAPEDTTKNI